LINRTNEKPAEFLPTGAEMALWEKRWVETQKELSQWGMINEYASNTKKSNLRLEVSWISSN